MSLRTLSALLLASLLTAGSLFANPRGETGSGPEPAPAAASPDLSGEWRLFLPAGFERKVTLEPQPNGRYFLSPYALRGTYELRGDRLVWLSSERLAPGTKVDVDAAYEWELKSPCFLTLVRLPSNPPADYRGAVLFRAKEETEQERTEESPADVTPRMRGQKGPFTLPAAVPDR